MIVEIIQRLVRIVLWQGRLQIGQTIFPSNLSAIAAAPSAPHRFGLLDAQTLIEIAKLVHISIQDSGWKFGRCIKHCRIKAIDLILGEYGRD